MGSAFLVYLRLGFEHIADINGYDHVLFITALCAVYALRQWRTVLWLVTAFTAGHSITLALATLRLLSINATLVEVLIPVTIIVASIINIVEADRAEHRVQESKRVRWSKYGLALIFGLIHGLGFSNFLRSILGAEESMLVPLLAFNLGLEAGQIMILFFVLLLSFVMVHAVKMSRYAWILVLSGATAGVALTMILDRLFV